MLYREIIAVCSEIHTKHLNTVCGQNVELVNIKPRGKYSDHWAFQNQYRFGWRSAVIFWGMDVSVLPGEMREPQVQILV